MDLFEQPEDLFIEKIQQSLSNNQQLRLLESSPDFLTIHGKKSNLNTDLIDIKRDFRIIVQDLFSPAIEIIQLKKKLFNFEYRVEFTFDYIKYQDSDNPDFLYYYSFTSSRLVVNDIEISFDLYDDFYDKIEIVLDDYFNDVADFTINDPDQYFFEIFNAYRSRLELNKTQQFNGQSIENFRLFCEKSYDGFNVIVLKTGHYLDYDFELELCRDYLIFRDLSEKKLIYEYDFNYKSLTLNDADYSLYVSDFFDFVKPFLMLKKDDNIEIKYFNRLDSLIDDFMNYSLNHN